MSCARFRCPECGSEDIRVQATITATLVQPDDPDECVYPELEHSSDLGYADFDSPCLCSSCDYTGNLEDFERGEVLNLGEGPEREKQEVFDLVASLVECTHLFGFEGSILTSVVAAAHAWCDAQRDRGRVRQKFASDYLTEVQEDLD